MHFLFNELSNVPLSIKELGTREIGSYHVCQEVVVNGENIR